MHVPVADGLVGRHLAIRLDAVLQTEKLPACIANLDTALGGEECEGMSRRANHARWNAREGVGTIVGMLRLKPRGGGISPKYVS